MKKPIHISVIVNEKGTETSFYFKDATVGQLALINTELDILKKDIIERMNDAPKDYEVQDFGEEEDSY